MDRPEDMNAARDSLRSGKAGYIADAAFDKYVRHAYDVMKDSWTSTHANLIVTLNCKMEAQNLINQAMIMCLCGDDE